MNSKDHAAAVAIIGGTGLNTLSAGDERREVVTPYGDPSGPVVFSRLGDIAVAFLARHGSPHSIPPHRINYRANIWALKQLGIERVIAVNAVGGINGEMVSGSLVVPDQLIDYSYGREHTYADGGDGIALEHIDFSSPFDGDLRRELVAAVQEVVCTVAGEQRPLVFGEGVYGVTQGPRLETAAEINRMDRDGCDIVGMTAMPEAALARELGMAYASLCLVVNAAAGRSEAKITMEDIHRVTEAGMATIRGVLAAVVNRLAAEAAC